MIIKIKVVPRAKQDKVVKGELLKVFVREKPLEGRANKKVVELLAEYFGVKKDKVRIIRGLKSREKVVEILEE